MRTLTKYSWVLAVIIPISLSGCGNSDETSALPETSIDDQSQQTDSDNSDYGGTTIGETPTTPQVPVRRQQVPYPEVEVETNQGSFVIKLDRVNAPQTVDNFLAYVDEKFYNNTIFHQVESGFIVAAGGYGPDLKEKKTRTPVRNEADNGLKNETGTIAMVRFAQVDSAASQFLINLANNGPLDHVSNQIPSKEGELDQFGYCVFGKIESGWNTIEKIGRVDVSPSGEFSTVPKQAVVIKKMRRLK